MAVTLTQTLNKDTVKQATVIATLDADVTQTVLWATLGTDFSSTPMLGIATPILAAGGLSSWAITVMTTTTLTVVKTTTAGSGNAGIQAVFTIFLAPAFSVGIHPTAGRNPFALPV